MKKWTTNIEKFIAAGCLVVPMVTTPVLANTQAATVNRLNPGLSFEEEPTGDAVFYCTFKDQNGYKVKWDKVIYSGSGIAVLDEADLPMPEGYVLDEEWQTYATEYGSPLYIEFAVKPVNPNVTNVLNEYIGDKGQSRLVVVYETEDGSIVDSDAFFKGRWGSAGISHYDFYLGEDFNVEAPAGYTVVSEYSDSYEVPLSGSEVVTVSVVPDGSGAVAYSDDIEVNSDQAVSDVSAADETSDSQPESAADVETGVGSGFAGALGGLAVSALAGAYLLKKRK